MTTVQIERALKEQLTSGKKQVELRDDEGQLVGFFVPASLSDVDLWELARRAFPEDEIKKARKEQGGQPLPEIRDELEQRWPST